MKGCSILQHFYLLCILLSSSSGLDTGAPRQTSLGKAVLSLLCNTARVSWYTCHCLLLNTGHGAGGHQELDVEHHLGRAVPRAPDEVHNYTLAPLGKTSHCRK